MLFMPIENIVYATNEDSFPFVVSMVSSDYPRLLRLRTRKPMTFISDLVMRFRSEPWLVWDIPMDIVIFVSFLLCLTWNVIGTLNAFLSG